MSISSHSVLPLTTILVRFTGARGEFSRAVEPPHGDPASIVGRISSMFEEFAQAEGLADQARRSVLLVLDELLSNALSYSVDVRDGYALGVRATAFEDRVELEVSDDGQPFDPTEAASAVPEGALEERPVGGLGLVLVRRLMDEVEYRRADGLNVVRLIKYRAESS